MQAEKLTKLFQAVGAALALPAAAAGVFTVYKTNFSPDVACQNLRASIVSTMEKNVALEAKKALLKKEVAEFDKTCGDMDPAARAMFQAVLDGKAGPGDQPSASSQAARPVAVASSGSPNAGAAAPPPALPPSSPQALPQSLPSTTQPATQTPPVSPSASPAVASPPSASAAPAPAPMAPAERPVVVAPPPAYAPPPPSAAAPPPRPTVAAPQALPPSTARAAPPVQPPSAQAPPTMPPQQGQAMPQPGQGQKPAGTKMAARPAAAAPAVPEIRGWVVLARRDGPRRAEINFDGFAFSPTAFPPPGTMLTARATLPVLAAAGAAAPGRPPEPQNVLRPGSCVKVLSTRVGAGRLWGEVVSVRC